MKKANERQVDGTHYQKEGGIQHWDFAAANEFDYFQGQITKYVTRWKKKNGIKDLEKAQHFLEKYIELQKVVIPGTVTTVTLPRDRINQLPVPKSIGGMAHPFGYDGSEDNK